MEVVGLALAIPPVLGGLLRVIKFVNDVQAKFDSVPTTMASMAAQCSTMHIVLGRLQYLDISRAVSLERERTRLLQDIGIIISGCKRTLAHLESFLLESYQTEGESSEDCSPQIGTKARLSFMRQEAQIKDVLSQLFSYHSSILIILASAQSQSIDTIQRNLESQATALGTLLERSMEVSTERNAPGDNHDIESLQFSSIASDELSTTAFHFDRQSQRSSGASFEFDPIIADSRIYQRALGSSRLQKSEYYKSQDRNCVDDYVPKPEPAPEKPKKLTIKIEASINVDISNPPEWDETSRISRGNQNLNVTRHISEGRSLVMNATRNAFTRARKIRNGASMRSDLRPLELVVTGYGVDKIALVRSLAKVRSKDPTDTPSVSNHSLCIIEGRMAFLHVVDTPLDDDHYLVRELFFKHAQCFMLVYDVGSRKSFELALCYYERLTTKGLTIMNNTTQSAPMILVGNNTDCGDIRQVSAKEGEELAKTFSCSYIETGSETGLNVEQAFILLMHAARSLGTTTTED